MFLDTLPITMAGVTNSRWLPRVRTLRFRVSPPAASSLRPGYPVPARLFLKPVTVLRFPREQQVVVGVGVAQVAPDVLTQISAVSRPGTLHESPVIIDNFPHLNRFGPRFLLSQH
jgi:hypothetical protein